MAPSRVLCFLGVLLCVVVLVSAPASAAETRRAASNADELNKKDPIEESKACHYGCQLYAKGHCWICKPPPHGDAATDDSAAVDSVDDNKQVHGCARGCCSWFRGRCVRCCHVFETAAGTVVGENKNHRPPCRCCSYFRRRCARCCAEGEEAPAGLKAEVEHQN